MPNVLVLNGPNLNLLGVREPELYGIDTLQDIENLCMEHAEKIGMQIAFRQSNHEGVLIDWVHEIHQSFDGLIINAAGYTRTSIALLDAIKAVGKPTIELHLTNLHKREAYRPPSYISYGATAVICGFGAGGYVLAMDGMRTLLATGRTPKGSLK